MTKILSNDYVDRDFKMKVHYHIIEKQKDSAHKYCRKKVKLSHKTPIVLYKLNNHASHLIMQEMGKWEFKINFIANGFKRYLTIYINNKINFIDTFHILSFPLDSLHRKLYKKYFNYFSQEFHSQKLHLVKQTGCYSYEYMKGFEKFKEELSGKEKFSILLRGKKQ